MIKAWDTGINFHINYEKEKSVITSKLKAHAHTSVPLLQHVKGICVQYQGQLGKCRRVQPYIQTEHSD